MDGNETKWAYWARALQGHAQSGLAFAANPFERERYEQIRLLAAEILHSHTGQPIDRIEAIFAEQIGYATPKVDVRAAVFDAQGRILMVREIADGCWSLPGGWADVNFTPAENAIKETLEESGYKVVPRKLAAVWDYARQGHPVGIFSCCKLFFLCRLGGGVSTSSIETSEVQWFTETDVPSDLSLTRVLPRQVTRMFDHYRRPDLPTDFD